MEMAPPCLTWWFVYPLTLTIADTQATSTHLSRPWAPAQGLAGEALGGAELNEAGFSFFLQSMAATGQGPEVQERAEGAILAHSCFGRFQTLCI